MEVSDRLLAVLRGKGVRAWTVMGLTERTLKRDCVLASADARLLLRGGGKGAKGDDEAG